MDNVNNRKVGEPGPVESLIPIWGSGLQAIHSFENGKYLRGTFHALLAVTDWFLIKSIVTAGGKLLVNCGTNIASREAIPETVVRLALETSESMAWKKSSQGTCIVFVEVEGTRLWVKKVDPEASKFWQRWGQKSLDVQADGLKKLDDLAPRFIYQDGRLVIEHVEPLGRGFLDPAFFSKTFLRSYFHGSRRLGTPFNDIRPWNMGKNGKIFDPVYHPLHEAAVPLALELGVTFIRIGDQLFIVYSSKEKEIIKPIILK
jgi:hypothetical protein